MVISTNGSVINKVMENSFFSNAIHSFVSDRPCKGEQIAIKYGKPLKSIYVNNKKVFSDLLLTYLKANQIDLVISFYLRLFEGQILTEYKYRIINLHLSLLPSFSGFNSFLKAINYGTKYLGTTVHFIDNTVDNGPPIIQSVIHNNHNISQEELRHALFEQQCRMLLQVVKWFAERRVTVKNNICLIEQAQYNSLSYSPSLDFAEAQSFASDF